MSAHIGDKNDWYEYNCTEYFQGEKHWTVWSKKKLTRTELEDILNDPEHQPTELYETWAKDSIDAEGEDSIKVSYDDIFDDHHARREFTGSFKTDAEVWQKDNDVSSLTDNSESEPDENGRSMSMANNPSFTPNKMKKLEDTADHAYTTPPNTPPNTP